jgi:uncharacterized RDD family membrane protein YckC
MTSGTAVVCPHCGTELTDGVTARPGRHGPVLRENPTFRNDGLCVSIWGQTLGKRAARTRVVPVRPGALRPSLAPAFVRAAMLALSSLLFLLPRPAGGTLFHVGWAFIVFPMLRQRQRRGSPDLLAGTIVVDARTYREAVPDATL